MRPLYLNLNHETLKIPVIFTRDVWPALIEFLQQRVPQHALYLIADENVSSLYHHAMNQLLSSYPGFRKILSFPAGEKSKSRTGKNLLEDALLKDQAGRDSVIVAVGGGVTGDLAGFVAANLHRGIPLIHVPTSLLAQVDSSIGGKVGINHPAGKNLLGSFYQPQAVFVDAGFFRTLPEDELRNGMAEVIKYGVTMDDELWKWLVSGVDRVFAKELDFLEKIVQRSISLKIGIVEKDEGEQNLRSLLNFGHTVGHAVEKLSHFHLKHGYAVAAGMEVAAVLSQQILDYPMEKVERLRQLLRAYGFPSSAWQRYPLERIWEIISTDKKARQRSPRFTLLDSQGKPALFYPVSRKELAHALAAC